MKYLIILTFFFGIILTYLLGRLALYHETQSEKRKNNLFWQKADSFWWIIFDPEIFSKDQSPFASHPIYAFPPTQQSLHGCRGDAGIDLSHLSGIRTDRNVTPLKTKWSLSISHRVTHLSQSYHLETFPSSNGPFSSTQIEKTSRPFALINDPKTLSSYQSDLRSGLYRSYPLWKTRDGSYRLQSPKVGQTLLSPPSLLQRDHKRFLAWGASSWKRSYRHWSPRTPEGKLYQIASFCRNRNDSSRQGFLRPQDHRISGIQTSPFCHRRQANPTYQERTLFPLLSNLFLRHRDRRVYVSTLGVGKEISFRSHTTSYPGRPVRTAHPFLDGQVQLSGSCDQHETHSSEYLEVLQWPSCCRTDYQRTQRELSVRENPNETFLSQRGLFPYPLIFLQSDQLVQTTLPANGVPKYDA